MAKVNSKVGKAASMAGIKAPKAPKVNVKTPDQLKKEAEARAKKRMKALIRIAIVAGIALVIGLVVYFVKFHGRQPKDAFKSAVEYAYSNDVDKFKTLFTSDSISMVDGSMEGNSSPAWEHLMDGIAVAGSERPSVKHSTIKDTKGAKTAELTVDIDGTDRMIYLREEDGKWKINLNVAINPRKVTLPDDVPPEYLENFETSDEPEAWWEEEEEKKDDGEDGGNFFTKLFKKK